MKRVEEEFLRQHLHELVDKTFGETAFLSQYRVDSELKTPLIGKPYIRYSVEFSWCEHFTKEEMHADPKS